MKVAQVKKKKTISQRTMLVILLQFVYKKNSKTSLHSKNCRPLWLFVSLQLQFTVARD